MTDFSEVSQSKSISMFSTKNNSKFKLLNSKFKLPILTEFIEVHFSTWTVYFNVKKKKTQKLIILESILNKQT